jgi:cytochrome c-type biogenesis protein CcmF
VTGFVAHDALLVSLLVAAFGLIVAPFAARRRANWIPVAYAAVYTNFFLVTVAVVAMIVALVTHDFSVSYVAEVGSRATPLFYTVISLWGALDGSILFWAWVLALCSSIGAGRETSFRSPPPR